MYLSKRNAIYYLWYTDEQGHKRKVSTRCRSGGKAFRFLQNFTTRNEPKRVSILFSAFTADFLHYASSTYSPASVELFNRVLRGFQKLTGDCHLEDITARLVDQYKAKRLEVAGPTTVNIELRALCSIFNTALRWNLIQANPFKNVAMPRLPQQMPAFFTREEFAQLREAIQKPWLRELVEFAVFTGMRRGEILNLKWSQINFDRRVIIIQSDHDFRTKAGFCSPNLGPFWMLVFWSGRGGFKVSRPSSGQIVRLTWSKPASSSPRNFRLGGGRSKRPRATLRRRTALRGILPPSFPSQAQQPADPAC